MHHPASAPARSPTRRGRKAARALAGAAAAAASLFAPASGQSPRPAPAPQPLLVLPTVPRSESTTLSPAQKAQLQAMLAGAYLQGLGDRPSAGSAQVPQNDTDLIIAALAHARAARSGRLAEADFLKDWGMRPARYDPAPEFYDAVARDQLGRWIASLSPPYAGYEGLRRGLAAYRTLEAAGGWQPLAGGGEFALGASGPKVLALRRRLALEDKQLPADGVTFDRALLDAVRRAQRRYGLNPSGFVGAQTIAALNVPVAARIRQIRANMERWRWVPRTLARDRVQVNIAAAVLTLFRGDAPIASMRAVTGRPGDETPMLESQIHSIVINPPWNVPTSIAERELLPKERAQPGYLKREGFKVIKTPDGGTRLQQVAGPKSALGRFKFDFDNPYAVYLHDTPAQAGFARFSRLASHGCVRLEKPAALAELLLKDDPAWSGPAIQAAVAKGITVRARLPSPVSVYLLYWTAFASANGDMNFRDDPYGWDDLLASKLAGAARSGA